MAPRQSAGPLAQSSEAQEEGWVDHGIQSDGWRLRSRPLRPGEVEQDPDPLLAGYLGPERRQPDGSVKQSWVFTHPDHPTNQQTQVGATNNAIQNRPEFSSSQQAASPERIPPGQTSGALGTVPVLADGVSPNGGSDSNGSQSSILGGSVDVPQTFGSMALSPAPEEMPMIQPAKVLPLRIVPKPVEPKPEEPTPATQGEFDINLWKPSRENPGHVIKRIDGYDITEDKYGISYLYRLAGGGTTTEQGEHSGYLNWQALEAAGRLKKGATYGRIKRRIKSDSNR